jgi:hypothetical protein
VEYLELSTLRKDTECMDDCRAFDNDNERVKQSRPEKKEINPMGDEMENVVYVAEDESRSPPPVQTAGTGGMAQVKAGRDRARYDVYFTDRRIIAAVIFSTSELSGWGPAAQFQTVAAGTLWKKKKKERRAQFRGRSPDEILRLHPESYEVPYEHIQSVRVKKGLAGAKLRVEIVGQGRFDIPIPKSKIKEIGNILSLQMPGKVQM